MWYLPPETNTYAQNRVGAKGNDQNICAKASTMLAYVNSHKGQSLLDKCCQSASYFANKPK